MFIFLIVLFSAVLIAGIILAAVGWYRMSDTSDFDREQYRAQSAQAAPTREDPAAHLRKKAEEGDARSQFDYGVFLIGQAETYPAGDANREKAYSFGMTWIKMAAKQSYGPALLYCGDESKRLAAAHYSRGEDRQFLEHADAAMRYYRRAVEINYPAAIDHLEDIERAGIQLEELRHQMSEEVQA